MDEQTEYVFTVIVTTTGEVDRKALRRNIGEAIRSYHALLQNVNDDLLSVTHIKVISGRPKVRIEVLGGVAEVAKCPDHVDVTIRDYDVR